MGRTSSFQIFLMKQASQTYDLLAILLQNCAESITSVFSRSHRREYFGDKTLYPSLFIPVLSPGWEIGSRLHALAYSNIDSKYVFDCVTPQWSKTLRGERS